jgi:S-adenosylmethionine:tRNA ribosyltransferase-isomerase
MPDFRTEDFEYDLPTELVAYLPAEEREGSRLMVLDRTRRSLEHTEFRCLADYLEPGDLLVVNDTKVIRARLEGTKAGTGGAVELLLLRELSPGRWEALVSPSRRLHPGTDIEIGGKYSCRIRERLEGAKRVVEFSGDVPAILADVGKVPLPPYIKREPVELDLERYQTVYAEKEGSVAAPTAGLHFSENLLQGIEEKGVGVARLTLHVGMGTFIPVRSEDPREHALEPEHFDIGEECCRRINETRGSGGRVVAVGTTSVRTLETVADRFRGKDLEPLSGWTHKFILPPYEFHAVDALVTNFHLPRSTLLMLVCAFAGREYILDAYKEAVERRYRFFSYGDAMLIL